MKKLSVAISKSNKVRSLLLVICVLFTASCAINQSDLDFMWNRMQRYYGVRKTQPAILYVDAERYTLEGYRVLGLYFASINTVYIFHGGYTLETIEHEFRHALGDDMNESPCHLREEHKAFSAAVIARHQK